VLVAPVGRRALIAALVWIFSVLEVADGCSAEFRADYLEGLTTTTGGKKCGVITSGINTKKVDQLGHVIVCLSFCASAR
jgi:hypothetical protein